LPFTAFDFFWSSSVYSKKPGHVWLLDFENGYTDNNYDYWLYTDPFFDEDLIIEKQKYWHVRCVSSETEPQDINFIDNNDGTISDNVTSLRWQKCTRGMSGSDCSIGDDINNTWLNSISYCENLTLGNNTFSNRLNWRMPNVNELKSIVYRIDNPPTTYQEYFPYTYNQTYWSSTTSNDPNNPDQKSSAIAINFLRGEIWDVSKKSNYNVRCVASEQLL